MEWILCESQEKDTLNERERKAKQNKGIGICGYNLVWKWKIFYLSTGLLEIAFSLK